MKNSYIRFINLLDALDKMNPGRALDRTEIAILEHVLNFNSQNKELLVGDVLELKQLGSQATIHGRLKNLSDLGYVKLVMDKQDGRKKFVIPTKLGLKYVEFMSDCLDKSMRA